MHGYVFSKFGQISPEAKSDGIVMAIYMDRATIFIGIPKTASTSIEQYISQHTKPLRGTYRGVLLDTGHASVADYESVGLWSPDMFSFSFVRNPWDRLVSAYFFLDAGGCTPEDEILRAKYMAQYGGDFEHFVTEFVASPRRDEIIHLCPQYRFVSRQGCVAVDFIGRFERLDNDFAVVCERMGIPKGQLPRAMTSEHATYIDYYNDHTRRIVEIAYARDIDIFEYCFG